MARRLRIHVPGGFYHVTLRGNHRQPIFFRDYDRDYLDRVVSESIDHLDARVHAYCWMSNHVHMLVQISDAPLGKLIRRIASQYARTVQAQLKTTGHLFERRYHAVLVDADAYLLTLIRYIHLNPVRAGLVRDAAAYPWSSHRTYLGARNQPWVTTSLAMRLLAPTLDRAARRYRELLSIPESPGWGNGELAPNRDQPQVLGDDAFVARVLAVDSPALERRSLDELVRDCGARFRVTLEMLKSHSRARDLVAARAWLGHQAVIGKITTICAVARLLGRTEGAVRHAMRRHPHVIDSG